MSWLQTLRVALRALARNKMRSFLTTLGMVIGVCAVIAMVAIGDGAKARVEQAFASMGSNMLIVLPGTTTAGGAMGGFGSQPTLTWDDLKAIQTEVPAVRWAAPALRANAQVLSEDQNWTTSVSGTTPDYFRIRSWALGQGSSIGESDVDGGTKVAVLGQTVVDKLFGPGANPVGQVIRVKNVPFNVVGVLTKKGQSPMGQDYDDGIFIPVSTFQQKIQGGLKNYLAGPMIVSATSAGTTDRAQRQIEALLRDRHRLQPGSDDDFSIRNLSELAAAQQEGTRTLTTLLAAIAAVSLLVGGIGIMNIMLVSVTERTREIGVRMAVGAKAGDIRLQFLVEALSLAVAGGFIGIALGMGLAWRLAASFGWPVLFRPDVIVVAVAFSGVIGVGFGLYPAHKASQLDPIQALRFE
ncbi:MAG: multidrug ABC transporter substrate-binding protein [Anaeromyxobacter sp. RBG_16_69_14]|nr:MAG: multidrug ABC transporter substrate-binding protein [Anaeromyxobacter sp. RBG_16_69_14]